jgi:hypothetical protein
MKRSLLAAVALLLTTTADAAPPTRTSQPTPLATSGNWSTTYYAADAAGNQTKQPMCTMKTTVAPGAFGFVEYVGGRVLFELTKTSWNIPLNTDVPISLQFDSNAPLVGTAKGRPDSVLGGHLFYTIIDDKEFLDAFASAKQMTLSFPQGNEPPWTIDMTGSREATTAFAKCMTTIPAATQPFTSAGTQPHGGGAQPNGGATQK